MNHTLDYLHIDASHVESGLVRLVNLGHQELCSSALISRIKEYSGTLPFRTWPLWGREKPGVDALIVSHPKSSRPLPALTVLSASHLEHPVQVSLQITALPADICLDLQRDPQEPLNSVKAMNCEKE